MCTSLAAAPLRSFSGSMKLLIKNNTTNNLSESQLMVGSPEDYLPMHPRSLTGDNPEKLKQVVGGFNREAEGDLKSLGLKCRCNEMPVPTLTNGPHPPSINLHHDTLLT